MAAFEIVDSRRLGTETCEFDVAPRSGEIVVGELFSVEERGSLWEYIILSITEKADFLTLGCVTWLPEDGALVGSVVTTRALNAVARKRYAKVLPAGLGDLRTSGGR
jgi:hypothetical protein